MAVEGSTTHVIASLYTFSNAAIHEILEQFESSLAVQKAECEHEANQFVIKCAKEDGHGALAFIDLLQKYVQVELTRELDLFEEINVKRLPGTRRKSAGVDPEEAKLNTRLTEMKVEDVNNVESGDQLLINHESVTKMWNPTEGKERIDAGLNFSAELLNQIGNTSGCRVEFAMDGRSIFVRGEIEQAVNKAVAKLNVLNNSVVFRTSITCTFDFYVPEGDIDALLQILPLKESLGRKLSTTLLPTASPHTKFLQNYMTVEIISEGGFDLQRKVRPRPQGRAESLLWQDYPYTGYGDGSYNGSVYQHGPGATTRPYEGSNDVPANPTVPTVDEWVVQSAAAADNPFAPLEQAEEAPSAGVIADELPIEAAPPVGRARRIKSRKAKGIQGQPIVVPSVAASVISHSTSRSLSKAGSKAGEEHDSQKTGDSVSAKPSVAGATIPVRHLDPPPIEPPFMPAPSAASSDSAQLARAQWEAHLKPDVPANISLLGFDPNEPAGESSNSAHSGGLDTFGIEEKVQRVNEVETRQFRRTMNQQKASTQLGSGNAPLLRSMETSATEILQYARSCAGHTSLDVNLGRLLINHQTGSAEIKRQPFQPNHWHTVFPTQAGRSKLETVFTEMLTTSSADVDFLVNMKLQSGGRLFEQQPCLRRVTYLFHCKTKSGEELVVEVNEKGDFKIRSSPTLVGSLNWHFPKREWDARLSVTSYGRLGGKYHDEAKGIVDNLQISPSSDGTTLGLFTKTINTELRVRSIMLCREISHYSTMYPDVLLHTKEVQDLGVWQMAGKRQEYHASARSQPQMALDGKLWWEVSLSSPTTTETLKENEKLEIGELTNWEAKNIVDKGVVKNLSSLAKDVVTRIDTVGFYNKGPKAGSGTRTSDRVMKDAGFW